MIITKYIHSCLLVETPERVALFDPGGMSTDALNVNLIDKLDDIFITHGHPDHFSQELIQLLVAKFPKVRITTTPEVVAQLKDSNITASDKAPDGVSFFDSPHENVAPLFYQPQQIGVHYLDTLTDPGDSHSFRETKAVLALPMTAPWGATVNALKLALELKPQHVLPIHDWHWSDAARNQLYDNFEAKLGEQGITFHKLQTGEPVTIDL